MSTDRRVADALVEEIERRVLSRLGSMAFLDYRFGKVASVNGTLASVYIGGDTYASPNFKIPSGLTLVAGDTVRVVIDRRGDRYVSDKF
jgi:hypothetical protein